MKKYSMKEKAYIIINTIKENFQNINIYLNIDKEDDTYKILHDYANARQDEHFMGIVRNVINSTLSMYEASFCYVSYRSDIEQKANDIHGFRPTTIFPRAEGNTDIDLIELIDSDYEREINYKVKEQLSNIQIDKFNEFKQKYHVAFNGDYDNSFQKNVMSNANKINKDYNGILRNFKKFLNNNGIVLLLEKKKFENVLGFSGFVKNNNGGDIPVIVVYESDNAKVTHRRMFLTIAHELYHLLYGGGEYLADKFAGQVLVSKENIKSILSNNKIIEKDDSDVKVKIEKNFREALKKLYTSLDLSLECILNNLYIYRLISKATLNDWVGQDNGKKRGKLIEELSVNDSWIVDSLR